MISYGKQSITSDDIEAVVETLKSDYLTQGPIVPKFEAAIAGYTGSRFAVACSHGTAALHLACMSLGVSEGDVVWTVPNTFVASANCALYCGAQVDFVDIDLDTLNISIPLLEGKLKAAKAKGLLPKVLIIVHFAGNPCDMQAIRRLADEYGVYIIEDGCHALGASYQSQKIGASTYSDITVFSFHPVKSITTAEGGIFTTNRAELADRARLLRNHGITRDANKWESSNSDPWHYEQIALGFNYRLSDIQAALGLSQLQRLDKFIARRRTLSQAYARALASLPLQLQSENPDGESAWHLMNVTLSERSKITKRDLFEALKQAGVICGSHYQPVHLQPYYAQFGFARGDFPNSEAHYRLSLSLPLFPDLPLMHEVTQDCISLDDIVDTLQKTLI